MFQTGFHKHVVHFSENVVYFNNPQKTILSFHFVIFKARDSIKTQPKKRHKCLFKHFIYSGDNLQLRPNGLLVHTGYRVRCLVVHHPPVSRGAQDGVTKTRKTFSQAIDTPVIFIWMPVSPKVISSERFV